ncbi:MAG: hypothetical protein M3433_06630 [Actinomycetota bacterium]|nr:hypothetical protein [Actinomycetota bacterium]
MPADSPPATVHATPPGNPSLSPRDHAEPWWERFAPLGAPGFLLTLVLGGVAAGASSPAGDAPAAEIATYFAEHQGGHLANTFLSALGAFVLYPWFLASLWRAIRSVEDEHGLCAPVVLVAGVALLGPLLIQLAGWGAAALQAGDQRDPAVAAALFDLGSTAFLIFPLPAAVVVVATTLANRSGPLLPVWLARAGLPVAAVMVLGAFPLGQFMFALFGLWLIAVTVALMRSSDRGRSAHADREQRTAAGHAAS